MADTRPYDGPEHDERFVEVARLGALQAGCVARRLQNEVSTQTKPDQNSPESAALTAADLATQDLLLLLLHSVFPEAAADAEEDTRTTELFPESDGRRPIAVLDPIDGTFNYSRGSDDYAVMCGWMRRGAFKAAVVHFPAWRQTFWARAGDGCWHQREDRPPERATVCEPDSTILVSPRVPEIWLRFLCDAGFACHVSRCSAVDATAPINGRASCALSMGPTSRRRPTGLFLTHAAGGTVLFRGSVWKGEDPIDLAGPDEPIVTAASEEQAQRIQETLRR